MGLIWETWFKVENFLLRKHILLKMKKLHKPDPEEATLWPTFCKPKGAFPEDLIEEKLFR